jgi:hypothetical protein
MVCRIFSWHFSFVEQRGTGRKYYYAGKGAEGRGEVTSPQLKQSLTVVIKKFYVKVGACKGAEQLLTQLRAFVTAFDQVVNIFRRPPVSTACPPRTVLR